ncbi:MAG: hypothetical protein Q9217_000509 [Psora testacea]
MESSVAYPDSPMDAEDAVYSCKGCGEILEEGKAFELAMVVTLRDRYSDYLPAGNRWHIDCFRCNTCSTILDSDANLLLLGDGSLICNNCTYSCSVCADKIEDLAILTGDQAFCANCFKCRNCKKKIENLKYARTSQGIFCMDCHESLMQRRRKKSQKNPFHRHKHPQQPPPNNNMLLYKSLPSLPPSAVDRSAIFPPDNDSPRSESYSETPTDLAPAQHQRPSNARSRSDFGTPEMSRSAQKRPAYPRSRSSKSEKRERSNSLEQENKGPRLTMLDDIAPRPRTNSKRHSNHSDISGNGEDFFIPMKLDPNPAPGPSPLARRDHHETRTSPQSAGKGTSRDYFNAKNSALRKQNIEQDALQKLTPGDSANGSRNSSQPNSPHIAYQERGRQLSTDYTNEFSRKRRDHVPNNSISSTANDTVRTTPATEVRSARNGDTQQNSKFMLQEVPKSKKSEKRNSKSGAQPPQVDTSLSASESKAASESANTRVKEQQVTIPLHESPDSSRSNATLSGSPRDTYGSRSRTSTDSHTSPLSTQMKNPPERGDSLAKSGQHPPPRRSGESGSSGAGSKLASSVTASVNERDEPVSAPPSTTLPHADASGNRGPPRPSDLPSAENNVEKPPHPPLRAKERLLLQQEGSSSESFVAPRTPPHPPLGAQKPKNEWSGLRNGDLALSPKLPRYNDRGDMFLDEDSGHGHDQQEQGGFLRRVSKSVRHARSHSDRSGVRLSKEPKWPKSPMMGSHSPSFAHEMSSPTTSSPESKDQLEWLKNELRKERQKTVEKEQQVLELEQALDAKSSIKQMNSELREKRSTMVVLDTQKEIVVRELEVLTDHIAAAKKSGEPLDVNKMTNTVLREFAQSLQSLKDSFRPEIEELTQQRNDLMDEVASFNQQRDKSFQEFEQLSVKNAQLADLNNQLVHQIQELYKANAGPAMDVVRPPAPPNGLGLYNAQPQKDRALASADGRDQRPSITESSLTGSTVVPEHDTESTAYLSAPQVVNLRKAQPKKFNWKKGGQHVAKGVTKGLKGAFSSEGNRGQRDGQYGTEGMPYGAMSQQEHPRTDSFSKGQPQDRGPGFGGLFGNPKTRPQQWKNSPNNSHPAVNADGPPRTHDRLLYCLQSADKSIALFGSELEQRAEYERSNIPSIVMRCIQEVDARGIDIEGIYRKSGGSGQVQAIKEGFERSNDYDISDPDLDINAVTSTLKQYFRKLPTPLITYEVYNKLLEDAATQNSEIDPSHPAHPSNPSNHTYKVSSMRHAINELPPPHRDTLEVLVFHLARVIEHEKDNLMTSLNVAVVFAPTIMRPESLAREMQDTQAKNCAVQFLIENCQGVFLGGAGVADG